MKNLFILLFMFSAGVTLAQGGGQSVNTELNVQFFNNQGEATIDFILEPIIGNSIYSLIYYADLEPGCSFPPLSSSFISTFYPDEVNLLGVNNYCINNGWGYGTAPGGTPCTGPPNNDAGEFQSGLYKVTVEVNGVEKTNFFYDNRHNLFPTSPCPGGGFLTNDIGVRYDVDDDKLHYMTDPTSVPNLLAWSDFEKCEVINWWEIATSTGT